MAVVFETLAFSTPKLVLLLGAELPKRLFDMLEGLDSIVAFLTASSPKRVSVDLNSSSAM